MTNDDLPRGRVPVSPERALTPGYPSLSQLRVDRRRLLKLAALSSVGGALGLTLTGCPGDGPGPVSVTTETKTPVVTPTTEVATTTEVAVQPPEYVPWKEPDAPQHLSGGAPAHFEEPIAAVIGGGPIRVTFKDGVTADLVIAAVVQPGYGSELIAQLAAKAAEHAALVRTTMADVPSSTLGDAAALDAAEERLRQALMRTIQGADLLEVSAARARPEGVESPSTPRAPSERGASARGQGADEERGASAQGAAAPAALDLARGAPSAGAKRLWTPCRRPGCTTCGAK